MNDFSHGLRASICVRWHLPAAAVLAVVLAAAAVFATLRAAAMFGPRAWAPLLPLSFVLMMALPFVLMPRTGWRQIGLRHAASARWTVVAVPAGMAAALACGALFSAVFGAGPDHAYATVAAYYQRQVDARGYTLAQLHLTFTLPALLFSPVGEEIFFRGLLQRTLEDRFSATTATVGEAGLFAAVHLCHHGLLMTAAGLQWRPLSGALWVALMFGVALALAALRRASGSLYPAMAAHAAFNGAMNVFIFAWLWP